MGLGELVAEIAAAGEAEADAIRKRAHDEASAIKAQAKEEAEAIAARWAGRATEEAAAVERRVLASAELEAKKLRLAAEAEALQAVRQSVEDRVQKLPAAERQSLTRELVQATGLKSGRAWVRSDDQDLAKELGFEVAGELEGLGGIVIEDPSGETREDLRFETLLDDSWRAVVRDVAGTLFGK